MLSANLITLRKVFVFLSLLFCTGTLIAQTENSPYSRYGLGDQLSSKNILTRGMGGVSAAYADILTVNFTNPASYSKLKRATLDFGLEVDSRTLKVSNPAGKYSATSPIISYVQLGLPLSQKRNWGMNIGLRPLTRINYKIERNERLENIDSVNTLYEGNGGSYEVYAGTGFSVVKNLSLGFNIGYTFGSKDYSTSRQFIPDSAYVLYYPAKLINNTHFGGVTGNAGLQYSIKLNKNNYLRLGAYGTVKRNIHASRDEVVETYTSTTVGDDTLDIVKSASTTGKIVYPSNYGFGFVYQSGDRLLLGADYTQTKWSQYRYFGATDLVQDSWMIHVGGQVLPGGTNLKNYWSRVSYRAGASIGQDYVNVDNKQKMWIGSLGIGLPMRPPSFSNQYSVINLAIEFGQRGSNVNTIKESFFRLALGLSLSDIWFIKRKYD